MELRIKDLRIDKDLTQMEIAALLNVNQSTYSDYETGRIHIPLEALCKLADFYHVNLEYLVGRSSIKTQLPK